MAQRQAPNSWPGTVVWLGGRGRRGCPRRPSRSILHKCHRESRTDQGRSLRPLRTEDPLRCPGHSSRCKDPVARQACRCHRRCSSRGMTRAWAVPRTCARHRTQGFRAPSSTVRRPLFMMPASWYMLNCQSCRRDQKTLTKGLLRRQLRSIPRRCCRFLSWAGSRLGTSWHHSCRSLARWWCSIPRTRPPPRTNRRRNLGNI